MYLRPHRPGRVRRFLFSTLLAATCVPGLATASLAEAEASGEATQAGAADADDGPDAQADGSVPLPPPPVLKTPPAVVTAKRRPTPIDEVAASITVIEGETLRRSESRDLLEALRDVAGLYVSQSGSRGGTTSVFARGGASDQNLVLIDGVEINRAGGEYDFANLTTENIDRVEVVRGPLSSLYGANSLASTIQIFTRRGEGPLTGEVTAIGGSNSTFEGIARVQGGNEHGGISASISRHQTDGLTINNGYENNALRVRGDWKPIPGLSLGLTGWQTESEFDFPTDFVLGFPGGFPPVDPDQGRKTRETVIGVDGRYEVNEAWSHELQLGYTYSKDRNFDTFNPIPSDFADLNSISRERRFDADYQQILTGEVTPGLDLTGTLGVEWEQQWYRMESSTTFPGFPSTTATGKDARRNLGFYAQGEMRIHDQVELTAGVRGDDNSEFGWFTSPFASAAWAIPGTNTRLRGAVGRGFKEPSFLENFGSAFVLGNPDLDPERSFSWEVGVDQTLCDDRVRLFLTWFDNEVSDQIAFVGPLGFGLGTFENLQKTEARGIEVGGEAQVHEHVRIGANYTWLDAEVVDAGGVMSVGFIEGDQLIRRPRHKGAFWIDAVFERFDIRFSGTIVGARDDLDFGTSPATRLTNKAYAKLDLSGRVLVYENEARGIELRLRAGVENLLNEDYQEVYGFQSPGIEAEGGLELTF